MSKESRNRFAFDEEGGAEPSPDFVYSDESTSGSVLLDEAAPIKRGRFRLFIAAGTLLFLTILGTVGALYYTGKIGHRDLTGDGAEGEVGSPEDTTTRDRYYIPQGQYSRNLTAAIAAYRTGDRDRARRLLEDFVNSGATDQEKSVALVYRGIMEMETERYTMARQSLQRALRYDNNQIAAYVNLSVVSRLLGNPEDAKAYAMQAKSLAPNDPGVSVILGNVLADGSDLEEAESAYRDGIERSPEDPLLHYNLALSLLRKDRYEEAELEFMRAAEYGKTGRIAALSHAHVGQIRFHKGRYASAADSLKKAVLLSPDSGRYHYNLGVVYLKMDHTDEALEEFRLAMEAGSSSSDLYRALAKVFRKQNQNSLAIQSLKKAVYSNPEDMEARFELAALYLEEQDLLRAIEVYKQIVNTTPGNASTLEALVRLGETYTKMESYEEASSVYQRVLDLDGNNVDGLYGLGYTYHKRGESDRAVAYWKRALETGVAKLDRDKERLVRMALASLYRKEQSFDLALDEYRAILKRNQQAPIKMEDVPVDLEMGDTLFSVQDYKSARASYDRASRAVSATPVERKRAFEGLALSFYEEKTPDALQQAKENSVRASRLDPSDPGANLIRAKVLLATGSVLDQEKAIEILRAITESDVDAKTGSRAYSMLGQAYLNSGEYLKSMESLDFALQLDPADSRAYALRKQAASAYEKSLGRN